jgi:TatD DNase family protein
MMLCDAHCHYHDEPIAGVWPNVRAELDRIGLKRAVVNGTGPDDWQIVADLVSSEAGLVSAFGVHPLFISDAGEAWRERLLPMLDRPGATVGEIGIDRARPRDQWPLQERLFVEQWRIAAERGLPTSVHCVQAPGRLLELLGELPRLECGFLLHGYSGSAEMVGDLAKLGARFSFSVTTLQRPKTRSAIERVAPDRLLMETDAPYMPPGEALRRAELPAMPDGRPANHPANLAAAYELAAEALGMNVSELAEQVEANFTALFVR